MPVIMFRHILTEHEKEASCSVIFYSVYSASYYSYRPVLRRARERRFPVEPRQGVALAMAAVLGQGSPELRGAARLAKMNFSRKMHVSKFCQIKIIKSSSKHAAKVSHH